MTAIETELARLRLTLDASDLRMDSANLERLLLLCATANVEWRNGYSARIATGKAAIAGAGSYGLIRNSGTGDPAVTYTAYVVAARPGERMEQHTVRVRSSCEYRAESDACAWFRRRGFKVDHVIALRSRSGRVTGNLTLERVL